MKVYGMGGKVDIKQLKKDLCDDLKKLEARKKVLVEQKKFTGLRKSYYYSRKKELEKLLK